MISPTSDGVQHQIANMRSIVLYGLLNSTPLFHLSIVGVVTASVSDAGSLSINLVRAR